jgi:hypothetical protein
MVSRTSDADADAAWDRHERMMTKQPAEVSSHLDRVAADEWDATLVDGCEDIDEADGYATADGASSDDDASVHSCLDEVDTGDSDVRPIPISHSKSPSWSAFGVVTLLLLLLLAACGYAMVAMGHSLLVTSPTMLPIATALLALSVLITVESLWATVLMLNGGVWHAKQRMALSPTESEYYAAADAVREAARVRALHHVTGPITDFEDSPSCIRQAANPCDREGQKHIDVRAHYLREQVRQSNAMMEYVSTEKQIADALSKNLPKPAFERHRASMGLELKAHAPPAPSKHVSWNTQLSSTR